MSIHNEREREIQSELKGRKIWLLKFPLWKHYQETAEEIKRLARKNELKIMDANVNVGEQYLAKDAPKLTPVGETKKPATKKAAKKDKEEAEPGNNGDE